MIRVGFIGLGIAFLVLVGRESLGSVEAFDCVDYARGQAARGVGLDERTELRECLDSTVSGPFHSLEAAEKAASELDSTCPGAAGPYLVALGGSGRRFTAPYAVFCPNE